MNDKFIGTWILEKWQYLLDEKELPLWEDKKGILIYTSDGMMSAILMDGSRKPFDQPFLSKGTTQEKEAAVNGYVSYAGSFKTDEHKVYHHVHFSLLPNWIGTTLERYYQFEDDDNSLVLSTASEIAPNGKSIKNILTWQRKY
ncbi:MAG: lipocalin-like domain-containing protein [Chitinophagales bacterium]